MPDAHSSPVPGPGVALIPARGGSRRIPRKNIRPFLGVPALARVIDTVLVSGIVGSVVVSTDDPEIAELAIVAGATVPDLRPDRLADDVTTTIDVVRHAINEWFKDLAPTVPLWVVTPGALLIKPEDLREAHDRFLASGATFLVPVLRYPHPVERCLRVDATGRLRADAPEHLATRTQDLEPAFHDSGQFSVGRLEAWLRSSPLTDSDAVAMELSRDRAIDIDHPEDWALAESFARIHGLVEGSVSDVRR